MLTLPLQCSTPVWSNFEIADMDFWRGEAYTKYFDYLESQGGFYYEVRERLAFAFSRCSHPLSFLSPSNSDGATHPCTPLEPLSFHRVIKFISSTILDMSIAHILTARKMRRHGQQEGVHAIHTAVSVSFFLMPEPMGRI